jgi:hypothetical protein
MKKRGDPNAPTMVQNHKRTACSDLAHTLRAVSIICDYRDDGKRDGRWQTHLRQ